MKPTCLAIAIACLIGCGAAPHTPTGRLERGDAALADGETGQAAQHYYNAWYRLRPDQSDAAQAQRQRAVAGLEAVVGRLAPKALARAKALIDQRAGALAFDLVFPLFVQDPLSSRWRPAYLEDRDLIRGATPLAQAALRQIVGLDLGPHTVPLQVTLDRLALLTLHYRKRAKGRSGRLRRLLWPIAESLLPQIDALIAQEAWAEANEATQALLPFGTSHPDVAPRRAAARAGFARRQTAAALALADSHPHLAAVCARLALAFKAEHPALARLAQPAALPPIRIALGQVTGPCADAAREVFATYTGPADGAHATLDVAFQACGARTERRTRTETQTVYDTQTVTRTWSDATPKFKLDYQCKRIKVCRVEPPPFRRKTWTCPGYVFKQVCGDVRVPDGFTYHKRTKQVPVRTPRTVTRSVPYDVSLTDLRATATLRGLGEPVQVGLDHVVERTGVSPAKLRRDAYASFRQRVEAAVHTLEGRALASAPSPLDAAEIAARQAIGRKATLDHLAPLAAATGVRPDRIARLFDVDTDLPAAERIPFPAGVRIGPVPEAPCTNDGDATAVGHRRRLRSPFRRLWTCPVQRALGYDDDAWAAEVQRLLPRVHAEPLPEP